MALPGCGQVEIEVRVLSKGPINWNVWVLQDVYHKDYVDGIP